MVNMKSKEELKIILDDFIKYKDYFENPPEEAFVVNDWDYSQCKEAREIVDLLYDLEVVDYKYHLKLPAMEQKYGVNQIHQFSREKLTLEEVFAVLTWLHRDERHCGGSFLRAIENGTFYNLLCRLEEIKSEL